MNGSLTPLQRFFLAFIAFFSVLFNRRFAEEVKQLRDRLRGLPPAPVNPPELMTTPEPVTTPPRVTPPEPVPAAVTAPPVPAVPVAPPSPAPPATEIVAMHVLGVLQRDGRLIDFLSEDLNGFTDSEIGAAARTVHAGCRKTLDTYVELQPLYREPEGASITVARGFDPAAVRLTGNVVGEPPFKGSLRHHGWRVTRATFPPLPPGHDPHILAPAEVEL